MTDAVKTLTDELEAKAEEWRGVHALGQAAGLEYAIERIRQHLAGDRLVTLQEAHELGGYSVDHLRRMIRNGNIPNAGRPNAPALLESDVPSKPGYRTRSTPDPVRSIDSIKRAALASRRR